ncbi:hypothetical protein BGZ76_000003 [Entomortierella beljakovae]|nr:hypothetical protein BGZ76_000003 [Entomortierella beljakovae]
MAILRSMPLRYTRRKPILDLEYIQPHSQSVESTPEEAERGHAVHPSINLEETISFGDYPPDLFQLRVHIIQEHITTHFPSTFIYIASLATVLVVTVALIVTALAINVSDGKPWEHKEIVNLLQSFNDQDMSNYGVLYRIRPSDLPTSTMNNSRFIRLAYRLNLGLPQHNIELTTISHIDQFSFQDHPASDPHASPEEILARENELPKYHPKAETDEDSNNNINNNPHQQTGEIVLGESHPPNYDDIVLEITTSVQSGECSSSGSPQATPSLPLSNSPSTFQV